MLFSFGKHNGFNIHIYNLSYSHTNNLALLLIIHIVVNPIISTECDFKSNDIYEIPFLYMECDFNTYKKNIISFSHTGEFPISCNNYGEIYRTHTRILGVLLRKAIHIQYGQFHK